MSCSDYTFVHPKVVGRKDSEYIEWQTDAFEADCNEFYILEDGTLMRNGNRVFEGIPLSFGDIEKANLENFEYTGTVHFYTDEKFQVVIDFKDGKVEKVWRGLDGYKHLYDYLGWSYDDDDFDFDFDSCPHASIKL
jgi:hypothetical protein